VIIGEITKHVGIDRIVAKRLRVLLQTVPAKPTVDVQVQSPGLLSAAVFEKDCFAWIGRNRRLAKDFEATIGSARAFLYAASVMLLVRRIAHAS